MTHSKWYTLGLVALLAAGLLVMACENEEFGKKLPVDAFQFPTGLAIHPAGFALVASGNFDVGYVAGSLRVIDLNLLAAELSRPADQRTDPLFFSNTIMADQGIRLGNFAGTVAISEDGSLAAVTIRETDELILIDLEVVVEDGLARLDVSCWPGEMRPDESFPECDGARHRVVLESLDPDHDLMDPYDVILVDEQAEDGIPLRTAWVSFLRSGRVQAIDIPIDRDEVPRAIYEIETGVSGASDLAQSPVTGLIYITSRFPTASSNPVYFFDPQLGDGAPVGVVDFFSQLLGGETRSLAFAQDGVTVGLVVRNPDMLVLVDTSLDEFGEPLNAYRGAVGLGNNPSRVRALGDTFFVTGAKDDTLYMVDDRSGRMIQLREDVCRGPFEVAFWDRGDLTWALVSCFEDSTVAVIDVHPASDTYLEVLARVGEPMETN